MSIAAPTATGPYMRPLAKLAEMLAEAPSVQARFGVADAANAAELAAARIIYPALEDGELDNIFPLLPVIVFGFGDRWSLSTASGGAQNYLRPDEGGSSIGMLLADVARYPSMRAMVTDFGNWLGAVFNDLRDEAAVSAQLAIMDIRQDRRITVCSIEEQQANKDATPWLEASFFLDWN